MSRWIDADAWCKAVQKHYTDGDCADDDRYELGINVGITKSRNVMMSAPSIDIVRCKECKYFIDNLTEDDTDEMYDACRWDWKRRIPNPDDFCSYGERKDEPQDNSKKYMMSDFSKYCPSCKYKYFDEWTEPCATCLLMKGQINTDVPIHYEENSQTDYDKGLQLFADILFDKEKSEQFLKECKAMGIEPQTEREGE